MNRLLVDQVVKGVAGVLGNLSTGIIGLHEPEFHGNEWKYIKECLDTGWVSSVGQFVDSFEKHLAEYVGTKYAVAVVNGTAALHISLLLAGVEEGDEVIIPSLSFIATANAVSYCGAVPHFADSERISLGLDPYKLQQHLREIAQYRSGEMRNRITGRRIKAIVPMHTFGHPADLDGLSEVCKEFNLVLIEDAAESLGSYYKGRHTGTFGRLSAFSFNGNKVITTGGGGAIVTNDSELARMAKHLTTTAKVPHKWDFVHDRIGYNYRMPNINAALGCAQLEQLPSFLDRKRLLSERFREAFEGIRGISFMNEPSYAKSNYWLNALLLDEPDYSQREEVLRCLNDNGFMSRPAWEPLHRLQVYSETPRMDLSVVEQLSHQLINIPSSPQLYDKRRE